MIRDTITYAVRNLTTRRLRSWLTIIGIFIGIAAVVSLISLGQGLEDAITDQFATLGANRITVQPAGGGFGPPGIGASAQLDESDRRVVARAANIREAAGRTIRSVSVEYNRQSRTFFVTDLPEDREQRAVVEEFQDPTPTQGRLLRPDDRNKVHVGSALGEEDTFDKTIVPGRTLTILGEDFEVVGVLTKRGTPQSDQAIIMNNDDMRDLFGLNDTYGFIVAQATSAESIPQAKEAIEKDLRSHRNVDEGEEDFSVETAEDVLSTFTDVLGIVTGVLAGIAAISLLVGGIGIMTTMYTAVVQRTQEIGIMKAIGATNEQVQQIFLLESGLLGLVGGIIGVLLGVGLSKLVEIGAAQALGPNVLQATSPAWLIIGALTFSFVVGTISGWLPAKRAAELPPVEALR